MQAGREFCEEYIKIKSPEVKFGTLIFFAFQEAEVIFSSLQLSFSWERLSSQLF
jgi:hypothetical protein